MLDEVEKAIVGKREPLTLVLAAILAKGHVLLEDFPGLGKTLAARSFAQALGLDFARAQFTPDLLPADLTGSFLYNQREGTFEFRRGPLFTGLLLADEINRTPPKTQSALLEAMQERQVTVEGETFPLPEPFHVLATANPIEYEGTYPLPEAQLDRFLLRVSFGYPSAGEEYDVLARRLERRREEVSLDRITDASGLLAMQEAVETVRVDESVGRYCVDLATATRNHQDVLTGSSPRGSLGLVLTARAFAVLRGRDYVIPEDVKVVARSVLAHRITVQARALDDRGQRSRRGGRGPAGRCPRPPPSRPRGRDERLAAHRGARPGPARRRDRGRARGAVRGPGPGRAGGADAAARGAGAAQPPASSPRIEARLDHVTLHEGQGTRSRLLIDDTDGRRVRHPGRRATRRTSRCTRPAATSASCSARATSRRRSR